MANAKSIPTLTEEEASRFWSKVHKGPDCWMWAAGRSKGGYGAFAVRGKMHRASRLAASLSGLHVSGSVWVLHRCDNPACVRPEHLFVGTPKDNTADMVRKCRARWGAEHKARGERHHRAKLTDAKVREIRALRSRGVPRTDVARMFGVSAAQITLVTTRRNWSHVEAAS
jgi:hypothetical protein